MARVSQRGQVSYLNDRRTYISFDPDFSIPSYTKKMSISNEALQKLVQEIETQAVQSQQQIALVKSQMASKQREMRMLQLTSSEVSTLPPDTPVYEGVGKIHSAPSQVKRNLPPNSQKNF
ncbi:putative prefoldin subunit 1 [Glarea lozoyensis 74030]|uniref:Putative prefoldin subunit 1 n=1 Tax=Glarea lozoyensis (strain ATCC 74030 / MF5533) TaxID=1104152 RepID=H0EX76_GLAL7|nr:putative prefoldin subunit 1 [Glarea lozoyensis 74030]